MLEEVTDNFGNKWLTADELVYGETYGSGSVGLANIQWLQNKGNCADLDSGIQVCLISVERLRFTDATSADFSVVVVHSRAHGQRAYVKLTGSQVDQELVEATRKLEDYPVYDDELVSEVESEWESEAWESWVREDLVKYLPGKLVEHIEQKITPIDEHAGNAFYFKAYRDAMDSTNTYPVPECSSVDIDVNHIRNTFIDNIWEAVREHHRQRRRAWRKNWLPLPI